MYFRWYCLALVHWFLWQPQWRQHPWNKRSSTVRCHCHMASSSPFLTWYQWVELSFYSSVYSSLDSSFSQVSSTCHFFRINYVDLWFRKLISCVISVGRTVSLPLCLLIAWLSTQLARYSPLILLSSWQIQDKKKILILHSISCGCFA